MIDGGCDCGSVRYRLTSEPMIVHCCHCSWCQRETGSAFAVNAVIETDRVEVSGEPDLVTTPSASGKGQEIARCPTCRVALWSHYPTSGRKSSFIRVGTMDDPGRTPPDVRIFTSTKQPWVTLADGKPVFAEFYPSSEGIWSEEARARWKALMTR